MPEQDEIDWNESVCRVFLPKMKLVAFGSTVFAANETALLQMRVCDEDRTATCHFQGLKCVSSRAAPPALRSRPAFGSAIFDADGIATLLVPQLNTKSLWTLHYEVSRLGGTVALSRYAWDVSDRRATASMSAVFRVAAVGTGWEQRGQQQAASWRIRILNVGSLNTRCAIQKASAAVGRRRSSAGNRCR